MSNADSSIPLNDRESSDTPAAGKKQFPCGQCGAKLEFAPGTVKLKCPYCSAETDIPQTDEAVEEIDFVSVLHRLEENEATEERQVVACDGCGAQTTLPPNTVAGHCAFCSHSIVATTKSAKSIKPRALLPFAVKKEGAITAFEKWISSRWFAPSDLKKLAQREGKLAGIYVPFWTYDCNTVSHYTGQRGTNYTVTVGTGKDRRTETRIRWTNVSGVVYGEFDDVLVTATKSLPRKRLDDLEPWDLKSLVPYSDEYLSGFQAQSYQVTLEDGFAAARVIMDAAIQSAVRNDIGGDHQRVSSVRTKHNDITFKHILLPVWIAAYSYKNKMYQILVNARTSEVQGERPYSAVKICFAVAAFIALLYVVYLLVKG